MLVFKFEVCNICPNCACGSSQKIFQSLLVMQNCDVLIMATLSFGVELLRGSLWRTRPRICVQVHIILTIWERHSECNSLPWLQYPSLGAYYGSNHQGILVVKYKPSSCLWGNKHSDKDFRQIAPVPFALSLRLIRSCWWLPMGESFNHFCYWYAWRMRTDMGSLNSSKTYRVFGSSHLNLSDKILVLLQCGVWTLLGFVHSESPMWSSSVRWWFSYISGSSL
jgi:hypothetical protein